MPDSQTSTPAKTPWGDPLKLLPLLLVFAAAALLQAKGDLDGDGWRYLNNARNLAQGFFASPETLMFWNGPGYPLFILPWVFLGAPLELARLANAVALWLALVHAQGAMHAMGIGRRSLAYAYGLGVLLFLHGPLLGSLMSECLAVYLVCGSAWHYARACEGGRGARKHLVLAGLHLGGLALTKVFFGYVLEACLLASGAAFALFRKSPDVARVVRAGAIACALGLILCLPWLGYTWAQAGKAHFWGNSGGWQAWYLTWPEKEFRGDWLNWQAVLEHEEFFRPHAEEVREALRLDPIAQDSLLKSWARRNCREHPGKCLINWRANVNRMVFGYPVTAHAGGGSELATGNRSFVYAFPFFLLGVLMVPGWRARKRISPAAHAGLVFALIALGGTSLLSAIPRQVFPVLPLLGIWSLAAWEKGLRPERSRTADPGRPG